jgi:hypothetical protein
MNFGLWFVPVVAIGTVGTILAASLPVPPSLPSISAGIGPASPMAPPVATPMQAAITSPAAPAPPAIARPRDVAAAVAAPPGASPKHLARRPARRLAKATPDHHPRIVVHAVGPRSGAIVAAPPGPYPGMPMHAPTQIAMAPPPYGMPAPYWRAPYSPY